MAFSDELGGLFAAAQPSEDPKGDIFPLEADPGVAVVLCAGAEVQWRIFFDPMAWEPKEGQRCELVTRNVHELIVTLPLKGYHDAEFAARAHLVSLLSR